MFTVIDDGISVDTKQFSGNIYAVGNKIKAQKDGDDSKEIRKQNPKQATFKQHSYADMGNGKTYQIQVKANTARQNQ